MAKGAEIVRRIGMMGVMGVMLLLLVGTVWGQNPQGWHMALEGWAAPAAGGGGATNLVADMWMPYEFNAAAGAITIAQITNDCHFGHESDLNPNVSDAASLLSTSASGAQALNNKPQGLVDYGTNGLAISFNSATTGFLQYGLYQSNTMFYGFLVKTATAASGTDDYFIELLDSSVNLSSQVRFRNVSGSYRLLGQVAGGDYDEVTVNADTWYWVMIRYVDQGTCDFAVKDTSGALVGTAQTETATGAHTPRYLRVGNMQNAGAAAVTLYVRSIIVNWGETGTIVPQEGP